MPITGGGNSGGGGGAGTVDVVSNVAQDRVLGRVTAGSGDSEELTAAQTRTFLNVEDGSVAAGATGDAYATSHEADATAHDASEISNDSGVTGTKVSDALDTLDAAIAPTALQAASGSSDTITLDVSGLPAGDLELLWALRGADTNDYAEVTFNGVTASEYNCHYVRSFGTSSSNSSDDGYDTAFIRGPNYPITTEVSGGYEQGFARINNYKGTTLIKSIRGSSYVNYGNTANDQYQQQFGGALRTLTGAITSIEFTTAGGGNWTSDSYLLARVYPRT